MATTTTTCRISGLANGQKYSASVAALTLNARSVPGKSNVTLVASAPSAPRAVTVKAGVGAVRVTWIPPTTTGGAAVSGYTVNSVPAGYGCTVKGALTCVVRGLQAGQSHRFTVKATNARGTSAASVASASVKAL